MDFDWKRPEDKTPPEAQMSVYLGLSINLFIITQGKAEVERKLCAANSHERFSVT